MWKSCWAQKIKTQSTTDEDVRLDTYEPIICKRHTFRRYWVWTATGDLQTHMRVLFSSDAGQFQLLLPCAVSVPSPFPVPFQCLFQCAFCTFSWPCQQKCVSGKFCWNKKISYLFLAKKWVTWQNHWQAHTSREKALGKGTGKGTGKALGRHWTDTAHGNSKNSSWNCSSSGLLSWRLLSSLATCRCERVVEHRRLKHRVLRMKMLDLILMSQ